MSEVTRARILQAASDLGYVPNLQARSLVMQRTQTVGVITSDFSDHNLGRYIVGAEQEARRQGYSVVMTSIEPEGSGTEYALPAMMERRVDGILLAAPQMEEDEALAHVLDRSLPVVSLHDVPGGGVSTVGSDEELIGQLATRHLFETGRHVIATVIGKRGRRVTESRLRGYRRALEDAGLRFDADLIEEGLWETASALRRLHKQVPADCAVVGCDDIDMAPYTVPPLTTIHVPFYETGAEAMRLLLTMIATGSVAPSKVVLPVHLIVRASSG